MAKKKYNWQEIKQEFITANLTLGGRGLELKELAYKYGIPMNVLWNRSSKEGWTKELAQALKEKDVEISKQVQKAAIEIDKGELMEEYRLRSENYKVLTKVLENLMEQWASLTKEDFEKTSILDLIKAILACFKAMMQTAGLPRVFKLEEPLNVNVSTGAMSVEESALEQAKNAEFAQMLSGLIEEMEDEGEINV